MDGDEVKAMLPKEPKFVVVDKFICKCGKLYSTGASFRYHKYECGNNRIFKCPHCPYRGKRNTTLTKHMQAKHKDIERKKELFC